MVFKPGQSGNPSGRKKIEGVENIRDLARSYTVDAIQTLVTVMTQKNAAASAKVNAACAILDRGWGKPVQPTENLNVNVSIDSLSDAELLRMLAETDPPRDRTPEEDPPQLN